MIPRLDTQKIAKADPETLAALREAVQGVGFLTVHNTALDATRVREILDVYAAFFKLPEAEKQAVSGANRGLGASGFEQVDPAADADSKQVSDCGFSLPVGDPQSGLGVYAPNRWPQKPRFQSV